MDSAASGPGSNPAAAFCSGRYLGSEALGRSNWTQLTQLDRIKWGGPSWEDPLGQAVEEQWRQLGPPHSIRPNLSNLIRSK